MKQCAMCESRCSSLVESHLVPRAAYRAMKSMDPDGQIIQLNFRDGTAYYHDKQLKTRLLCSCCEDVLSKYGERPIGRLWANSKGFQLLEMLRQSDRFESLKGSMRLYGLDALPRKEVDSIMYFACSIFWRASVWPDTLHSGYNRALGPYAEELRMHLLNGTPVANARLIVCVNTNDEFHPLMRIPTMVSKRGVKTHYANMQGLQFMMYFGGSARSEGTENIFKGMKGNVAFVTLDMSKTSIIANLSEGLGSRVRSTGKLDFDLER